MWECIPTDVILIIATPTGHKLQNFPEIVFLPTLCVNMMLILIIIYLVMMSAQQPVPILNFTLNIIFNWKNFSQNFQRNLTGKNKYTPHWHTYTHTPSHRQPTTIIKKNISTYLFSTTAVGLRSTTFKFGFGDGDDDVTTAETDSSPRDNFNISAPNWCNAVIVDGVGSGMLAKLMDKILR